MDGAGVDSILQVKTKLQVKEDEFKLKHEEEVTRILVNIKIDPLFVALRDQVKMKEKLLDQQYEKLTLRVTEKEQDL